MVLRKKQTPKIEYTGNTKCAPAVYVSTFQEFADCNKLKTNNTVETT